MSNEPIIAIATMAAAADLDRVFEAAGRGPSTFTDARDVTAEGVPGTVTHKATLDMSADSTFAGQMRDLARDRQLPPIAGTWGEDGIITAQDAQTAAESLTIFSAAGTLPDGAAWFNAELAGLGLALAPEPEF